MNKKDSLRHPSGTVFRDSLGPWYSLDNAASIMPSTSDSLTTNIFRYSATFKEDIDPALLRTALDATVARFPYFAVELRRGLFWHYLVPRKGPVPIEIDRPEAPLIDYDVNKRGNCVFRVRIDRRTLACEFHHSVTDGTGGMRFLKNFVAEYLRLRGRAPGGTAAESGRLGAGDPDIYDLRARPDPGENEDAYDRHFRSDLPSPDNPPRAFSPPPHPIARHRYRITSGIIPLDSVIEKAHEFGASVTELLAAAYMDALQEIWLSAPLAKRRWQRPRIVINIPVNMRKYFDTKSNRNFSLVAQVTQDMRLGRREFPDIVQRAHHELRNETDPRYFGRHIARNVGATRSLAFRMIPLFLKDLIFKFLFKFFGSSIYSGSISNIGPVRMPDWATDHIERFDFLPSPYIDKVNVGVLSWNGALHVAFGSLDTSREIERLFFTRLRKLGLHVRVECNL